MEPGTNRGLSAEQLAAKIKALERPESSLWTYYIIRSILTGPAIVFTLPYLFFRYHTLRYRFDEEGIHMKVGILFRGEVNLTYSRIQDIHLKSGVIQRWFGLANVEVQTASGSSGAELVIEGFKDYEAIRDFLYTRMRGYRRVPQPTAGQLAPEPTPTPLADTEVSEAVALLRSIRDELRQTRGLLESNRNPSPVPPPVHPAPPPHV